MNNAGVGLPRDFYTTQIVGNAELLLEHILKRLDPGAARINQRAVDVEKEKAFGKGCFQSRDFRLKSSSSNLKALIWHRKSLIAAVLRRHPPVICILATP